MYLYTFLFHTLTHLGIITSYNNENNGHNYNIDERQPQHEYMEKHKKLHVVRMDKMEMDRKREARGVHKLSEYAQKSFGLRAKMFNQKRFKEKAALHKTLALHNECSNKHANVDAVTDGAVPAYLLDREEVSRAKVLSNTVKQKRKEKAGKWTVPIPKVKPVADDQMFKQIQTGKRKHKNWKRMITKVTFVGDSYTRNAPKFERFIRPTGLRMKKAHVTHPELKTTFCLDIICRLLRAYRLLEGRNGRTGRQRRVDDERVGQHEKQGVFHSKSISDMRILW